MVLLVNIFIFFGHPYFDVLCFEVILLAFEQAIVSVTEPETPPKGKVLRTGAVW